jgi:glycogen debranching enzyme
VALHATWRATSDRSLIEKHLRTAEGCLAWIDSYGDRDRDGLREYQTRSSAGYENIGWRDSGDAVMYEDGALVKGPKHRGERAVAANSYREQSQVADRK